MDLPNWLTGSPAAELQWIFGLAGILALVIAVLAIPTVFQMIWGRPNIKVDSSKDSIQNHDYLEFHIYNDPTVGRPAKWLWVQRDTEPEIITAISITESGGRVVARNILPDLIRRGTGQPGAQRVPLPPSVFGVSAVVAMQSPDRAGEVFIGEKDSIQHLLPGEYTATIRVTGRTSRNAKRSFAVGASGSLYWL